MTRSDLIIAIAKCKEQRSGQIPDDAQVLIQAMFEKIEDCYTLLIALEKTENFKELAELLRAALESRAINFKEPKQ